MAALPPEVIATAQAPTSAALFHTTERPWLYPPSFTLDLESVFLRSQVSQL